MRLPKILKFYSSANGPYPNYAVLPENKYMFKNIAKKQKIIEDIQKRRLYRENEEEIRLERAKPKYFNPFNVAQQLLL